MTRKQWPETWRWQEERGRTFGTGTSTVKEAIRRKEQGGRGIQPRGRGTSVQTLSKSWTIGEVATSVGWTVRRASALNYEVKKPRGKQTKLVHVVKIKKFVRDGE